MAKSERHPKNADGEYYVDENCINCGASYWIAPNIFKYEDGQSIVFHQPENEEERRRALMAQLSCPTASIRTETKIDQSMTEKLFPTVIDENVYHSGYHSKKSFGAASYFIKREDGNVLIDSPRFVKKPLVNKIEEMGGLSIMFLSHKDDVADHEKYAKHFINCERVLHKDDITSGTSEVERQIEGEEPIALADDLLVIPVPGHTKGSSVLLYREKYLFTGDHLYQNPKRNFPTAFVNHCWYDWKTQIASMEKLLNYKFEWILPGHGAGVYYPADIMPDKMRACVEWMKGARK